MTHSRRRFVATSLAGLAGLCAKGAFATDISRDGAPQTALTAEDGYRLWLRYAPPGSVAAAYRPLTQQVVVEGTSATARIIQREMTAGISAMIGTAPSPAPQIARDGAVVIGTPDNSAIIRALGWNTELKTLGPEGYIIRQARIGNRSAVAIASAGEIGALYGAFHLLRLLQTAQPLARLNVMERPKVQLRLLNHWDNLDGSIERGYAGRSLWNWAELPGTIDPRYADFARANASIGVNGAVVNSVNANARMLSAEYLSKVAALADVFRPYGVRMYLSANVAAPIALGGLKTADPLDHGVVAWWKAKAEEIYKLIPDFGGFTVKANSEGQPGPKDYGRSHAEGANVLADALAPHGGTVIWRAFIYDEDVDPDRAKRAYLEFTKLDGQFRANALVQVKNGAIDFMPREPFHPLFGALTKTPIVAEIQATQEYLGQAKHLVYLGTMWEEFLGSDTYAKGKGSTVAKTIEGDVQPYAVTGLAAVVNPGSDRNWCGHHFSQSNWYAAGRLAWNPQLTALQIADEWTRMTFSNEPDTVRTIRDLMMGSREAFVNYTMPLGLHHLIGGDHYAPMPQNGRAQRADWTATYYHQASADGIGFDRTMKGNQAVGQYFPPVRDQFDSLETCPEKFLLWFHRCRWDYTLKSGQTLWNGLCAKYDEGASQAAAMQSTWQSLAGKVDPQRHREVADRLAIQVADSAKWRDEVLQYFQGFSKLPIPPQKEIR
ncbi:MAG: alpha-glucuronidase family glycosyl hydrolase [Acidobacteriota bacterium]